MSKSRFIQKFFTSGIVYKRYSGSYRRLILLHALLYITSIALIFFALYNLYVLANTLIALLDMLAGFNALFALYILKRYKAPQLPIYLSTANLFIFLLSFIYINENSQFGLIWTLFFPVFAILINGRVKGVLFSSVFYAVVFVMAYRGIGVWQEGVWDMTSFIRFAAASMVLSYVVYFMDLSQDKAEEELIKIRHKEAETMKELKRLSITDPLTGLFNRRHFVTTFDKQFKTAHRHGYYFALFILDIDFFKQYNDLYGHHAGDGVLCRLSEVLKQHMRRSEDYIFRLGGEEFAGICIGEDREKIKEQILAIITEIGEMEIVHEGSGVSGFLSVSIGAKIINRYEDYDFDRLYKDADTALYRVKESGRNAIVFAD